MSWFWYALLSAVLLSISALTEKRILKHEHALEFAVSLALVNAVLTLPLYAWVDFTELNLVTMGIIFVLSFLGAIAFLLVTKSVRHMEVSEISPLLILGPGLTAILAYIFLQEKLSFVQVSGIGLLLIGVYILETHRASNLLQPLRTIWRSRYVHFVLIALVLYSLTSLLDRVILHQYAISPLTYIPIVHTFLAIDFLIMALFLHYDWAAIKRGFVHGGWLILPIGVLTVSYRLAEAQAISLVFIALASTVKRISSLFTTIIGGEIFHERAILRKVLACVIMIGGIFLLAK